MTETVYQAPTSVADVTANLSSTTGSRILAGGTDLLVQLRSGAPAPSAIIDIKHLPGILDVELNEDGLRIGAAAPGQSITERQDISATYPGLVEAIDLIGSSQIQGRGSVGGNLCNASPAADSVPALIANGAICHIIGPDGERQVPVADFTTGPGQTCLTQGEVLVALHLPHPGKRTADAYLRFTPRTEMDIAVVGAAVSVSLDDAGICQSARVAIGAVAPTALAVPEAAQALIGTPVDDAALAAVDAAASAAANPISDKRGSADFRRRVVGVLARRAAQTACQRAGGSN